MVNVCACVKGRGVRTSSETDILSLLKVSAGNFRVVKCGSCHLCELENDAIIYVT